MTWHVPDDLPSGAPSPTPITVAAPRAIGGATVAVSGFPSGWSTGAKYLAAFRGGVRLVVLDVSGYTTGTLQIAGPAPGYADVALQTGDVLGDWTASAYVAEIHGAIDASTTAIAGLQPAGAYLTALTGDVTASGPGSGAATLASVGTAGTYTRVTTDARGRVTSGTTLVAADIPDISATYATPSYVASQGFLTGNQTVALSGDATGSGATAIAVTLASTAVTPGSYTNANITVDAKGRLTAAASGSASPAVFVASGASHASGLVPDPGATAGTTHFLREDATFAIPGATVAGGTSGRIPYETTGGVLTDASTLTYDGTLVKFGGVQASTTTPIFQVVGGTSTFGAQTLVSLQASGDLVFKNYSNATWFNYSSSGQTLTLGSTTLTVGTLTVTSTIFTPNVQGDALTAHKISMDTSGYNAVSLCAAATDVGFAVAGAASQSAPLLALRGLSSTSTRRDLGYVDAGFSVSTDASYKGYVRICAQDFNAVSGGREGVRVGTDGSQALLGFYGATPTARAASPGTAAGTDAAVINAIITLLRNLGLCT